jgi:type I restriction enzyme M protein
MTDTFDIRNSAFGISPIHHLAPGGAGTAGGMAGFVLANGSMFSNQSGEGDIRRALIEADLAPRVTPTGKSLRSKVRKMCLPFAQENFSELCEE